MQKGPKHCTKNLVAKRRRRAGRFAAPERAVGHAFLRVGSCVNTPLPGLLRLEWAFLTTEEIAGKRGVAKAVREFS
jgi:hypothetical protein